jgi:hypothetical protein
VFKKFSIYLKKQTNYLLRYSENQLKIKHMIKVTLNVPDKEYNRFIDHIKRKFSNIQIKEKKSSDNSYTEDEIPNETYLLSEKSLAEDWLSDEDDKWDEVL